MKKLKHIPIQKLIWCKIRYYQSINGITDDNLASIIGVSVRTLREYDKNAENITLGKVDNFLYAGNISLIDLINS